MKKEVVFQANPLIEGRRDFSLVETRIFYLGLRGIRPKLKADYPAELVAHVISKQELVHLFGNDKYYTTLKRICKTLAQKTIEVEWGGEFAYYPVFAELSYKDDGLHIEFNQKMRPWLLDLFDKNYTRIPFEQVWGLRTQYSIRILELMLQYQNTKTHERTFTIEELKQYLGLPNDSYANRNNNFRRFVIDKQIQDINEKTDYKITSEPVKEGRQVVGFKLVLYLPEDEKKKARQEQVTALKEKIKGIGKA